MNKNMQASEISPSTSKSKSPASRYAKKKVRIIKKIRTEEGVWKFVSVDKINTALTKFCNIYLDQYRER
jgi:hypothetical protein